MTYKDIEYIKKLHIGLYELINTKADHSVIEDFLISKVLI